MFIKANLTKAEASAAYELRCRIRASAAAHHVTSRVSVVSHTAVPGVSTILPGTCFVNASHSTFFRAINGLPGLWSSGC